VDLWCFLGLHRDQLADGDRAETFGLVINNPGAVLTVGSGHSAIFSATGQITLSNAGTINGALNLGNAVNTVTLITGGRINGSLNLGPNSGSTLVLDGTGVQTIGQAVPHK
jgi:fibronectin-binding autotransporter adhesin